MIDRGERTPFSRRFTRHQYRYVERSSSTTDGCRVGFGPRISCWIAEKSGTVNFLGRDRPAGTRRATTRPRFVISIDSPSSIQRNTLGKWLRKSATVAVFMRDTYLMRTARVNLLLALASLFQQLLLATIVPVSLHLSPFTFCPHESPFAHHLPTRPRPAREPRLPRCS